jgi:hypothetical protein
MGRLLTSLIDVEESRGWSGFAAMGFCIAYVLLGSIMLSGRARGQQLAPVVHQFERLSPHQYLLKLKNSAAKSIFQFENLDSKIGLLLVTEEACDMLYADQCN